VDLPELPDDLTIETGWKPVSQVAVPPEMVVAIAQGLEEPDDIAARHGFTGTKWEKLKEWKPFIAAVAEHRAELERSGYTFRVKARFMAEDLLEETFVKAKNPETSLAQKLQVTQFLTRVAGLEPKEDKSGTAGEGFSVTINMNGTNTTISGNAGRPLDVVEDATPKDPGYVIAPLIDPTLFAEMAANQHES
jgi:hypothetical protein